MQLTCFDEDRSTTATSSIGTGSISSIDQYLTIHVELCRDSDEHIASSKSTPTSTTTAAWQLWLVQ
ncbi:hypothetical protein DPMN_003929 [Dreissena polymorpha]|uniref:Uncharacterized protein n=1 Tax=Dreissena polymorpha TaxID=45954 RepID=A0A9D4MRN7_DREPO|nr:hypothetical protein DPMN_003929 [Dreissena polymorpha]